MRNQTQVSENGIKIVTSVTSLMYDKKVIDIITFAIQFVIVAMEFPLLRIFSGKISEFIVHGTGPIPIAKKATYNTRESKAISPVPRKIN